MNFSRPALDRIASRLAMRHVKRANSVPVWHRYHSSRALRVFCFPIIGRRTSSVAGSVGVAGLAAYASGKHAINGLVQVAALEFGKMGVRINAVAPAPIDNAMMASIEKQASPDDPSLARQGFSSLIAMGRYGTNKEVANIVAFLASDEASYCTGGIYPVDGGFLAA